MKSTIINRILSGAAFLSIPLSLIVIPACLPVGGGLGGLEFADEDFDRQSPSLNAQGALRRSCEVPESDDDAALPSYQVKDRVFEHALCLCGDLKEVGQGLVTQSSSYALGKDSGYGHVGINGEANVVGNFDVDGTLDVAGGMSGVGNMDVGRLLSGDDVSISGSWTVDRDAWINGDLSGVGSMDVGGDLYVTGDVSAVGSVNFDQARKGFQYRGAPCGCGANEIIDVAAEVAARKDDNDNDLISGADGDLVLESGEYYFANPSDFVGSRSIVVRGRASVFIDGDLETVGNLNLNVSSSGELALWVSGTVKTVGNLRFDSGDERPRGFKLYMGGQGASLVNVGNASFVGGIYAPEVDIEYVGSLSVHGSLFANNLKGTGNLSITYDTDLSAPDPCADEHYQTLVE